VSLSLLEPDRWPELMSPAQVAKLMNIAPTTVGRWCDHGTIEAVKIGRVCRLPFARDGPRGRGHSNRPTRPRLRRDVWAVRDGAA
jgi:excisionase family DNA binding protein